MTTILHWTIFGADVLVESHIFGCTCSYHEYMPRRFGLLLPEDKSRNSWRVLYWNRRWNLLTLRWTLPQHTGKNEQ